MLVFDVYILHVFLIGVLSAFLNHFLNYCIGKPSMEFSPYEIFSRYTVWLSVKRLTRVGLYDQYTKQYTESLKLKTKEHEVISLNNDFKKILYDAADPFFTWERAVGMCPVCTGFWVSLGSALLFTNNLSEIIEIIVISHITIRILNKIL